LPPRGCPFRRLPLTNFFRPLVFLKGLGNKLTGGNVGFVMLQDASFRSRRPPVRRFTVDAGVRDAEISNALLGVAREHLREHQEWPRDLNWQGTGAITRGTGNARKCLSLCLANRPERVVRSSPATTKQIGFRIFERRPIVSWCDG
jgi:hypothetical protein